ncbi:hypothetical protein [Henriciella sp.]|uniref:hypothetical protein n=1 Tax=Henriciella sp. TaxID=1968823 RepID=UPI0026046F9B|nr:hypothetical protein [Henriciella sp.]
MSKESPSQGPSPDTPAFTMGDIADFENRAHDKLRHADDLEKRAETLRAEANSDFKKIELLKEMLPALKGFRNPSPRAAGSTSNRVKKSTWTSEILFLVQEAPEGVVSYADMKAALTEGPLGPALEQSDKSFYGALLKLESQGLVVRHNAHAFTPEAFDQHMTAVNEGRRPDVRPKRVSAGSPITDAVIEVLERSDRPLTGREVIGELLEMPQVRGPVERNNTSAYNVLSRLVKQHRIVKNAKDKTYRLYIEGEEPQKIGPVSQKTGPYVGEDSASLNGSTAPNGALL